MPNGAVFASFTVMDIKGKKSHTHISFPSSTDIAVLKTFVTSTAGMIDDLIKGRLIAAGIGIEVSLGGVSGLKTAPTTDSDVEEGAKFLFSTGVDSITGFRLPTFDEQFMEAGTTNVDLSNSTVTALVDRVKAGLTSGLINVSPSDSYGNDITGLRSAQEDFVSSRH